ncbi:hypothetical protein BDQ17DRAFT_450522 [Cyathus striatus]|nr:hypothetical protein BDQ17DRAFT_450522 [Cyathus striatus]
MSSISSTSTSVSNTNTSTISAMAVASGSRSHHARRPVGSTTRAAIPKCIRAVTESNPEGFFVFNSNTREATTKRKDAKASEGYLIRSNASEEKEKRKRKRRDSIDAERGRAPKKVCPGPETESVQEDSGGNATSNHPFDTTAPLHIAHNIPYVPSIPIPNIFVDDTAYSDYLAWERASQKIFRSGVLEPPQGTYQAMSTSYSGPSDDSAVNARASGYQYQ